MNAYCTQKPAKCPDQPETKVSDQTKDRTPLVGRIRGSNRPNVVSNVGVCLACPVWSHPPQNSHETVGSVSQEHLLGTHEPKKVGEARVLLVARLRPTWESP